MAETTERVQYDNPFTRAWSGLSPITIPLLALFTAMVIGAGIILIAGASPIITYQALFEGAVGTTRALADTIGESTPYIIAGLAVALGFKTGLFNIGAEGQMYAG